MDPNTENPAIAEVFGVALEPHGHIRRESAYDSVAGTSRTGIYVAGAAIGPETIDDSITQGQAAAMAALGTTADAA